MKPKRKAPVLLLGVSLVAGSAALAALPAAAASHHTSARTVAKEAAPLVVKLRTTDKKIVMSDTRFRPGVTEFRVGNTASKRSSLIVVRAADLDRSFKLLGKAFSGGPGSADAMAKFDRITTLFSGGPTGSRWQVRLNKGKDYYVLDTKTNNVVPFVVKGEKRSAKMERPDSTVTTTKDNMFETSGRLSGPWVGFDNISKEIHFLEADHVKNSTTAKDVRQALTSPKEPKWLLKGGFFYEPESPGVKTVHRTDVKPGKYLLICFMQSEEQDGVPHALMGMWKLVQGG